MKQEDWVLCRVFYKNRSEVSSPKAGVESDTISVEETSPSSGLPPLMDSYITFHQTQVNAYQQVPCFSITSSSSSPNLNNENTNNHHHHFNPNPIFPHDFHVHDNPNSNNNDHENHAIIKECHHAFGGHMMPNNDESPNTNLSPLACDRKMLEVVLNHLTKMEPTSPNTNNISSSSFGEVASSQTYNVSSQIALPPHMWNQY
ncbi:NAC domain-containing protein 21/22 [Bienertia sinuspersici]